MDTFTEAYAKLRDVVSLHGFEEAWQRLVVEDAGLKGLLASDGPAPAIASVLDQLRERIGQAGVGKRAAAILEAAKAGSGESSLDGTGAPRWQNPVAQVTSRLVAGLATMRPHGAASAGEVAIGTPVRLRERAAALKMLSHLYRSSRRGAQDVWVYTPPRAYKRWVFDELAGSEDEIKLRLDLNDEIYSTNDRQIMCVALAQAMKWSLDGAMKLAVPAASTRALVREWFADQDSTEAEVTATISTLKDGLKTIAGVCNGNALVFSDEPVDRNRIYSPATGATGWQDWAFVRPREAMNVVYIQGAFVRSGTTGATWKCALTVVHEVSHRALGNRDLMYDYAGLKPDRNRFPAAKALRNADSWAYFTADLARMLSPTDRQNVLKVAAKG